MSKKFFTFVVLLIKKIMIDKDNYFDMFGDFLFGKNDDELNKMYEDILKGLDKMSKDGKTPEDVDAYLKKMMKDNNTFTPPKVIIDMQNKIEAWLEDGLDPEELDNKISSEIGEPSSIVIRKYDDIYMEEKTWFIDGSLLVRTKEMTEEEIEEWEEAGKPNYFGSDNVNAKMLYDLNNVTDYDGPKQKELTLEEQLKIAIENEEYEKAAEIRDKIKGVETPENQKVRKGRPKKIKKS